MNIIRCACLRRKPKLIAAFVIPIALIAVGLVWFAHRTPQTRCGRRGPRQEIAVAIGVASASFVVPMTTTTTTTALGQEGCLCIFNVDRTLSAITKYMLNGRKDLCTDAVTTAVNDSHKGVLRLSDLGANLNKTFCKECYHGVVSGGPEDGSEERDLILEVLGGVNKTLSDQWEDFTALHNTSLVFNTPVAEKLNAVASIVKFIHDKTNLVIPDGSVWYFDDRQYNIQLFMGTCYNAFQVSCAIREGKTIDSQGLCGASQSEIADAKAKGGVHYCS